MVMDSEEFRKFGKKLIDFIADYNDNIRSRPVLPSIRPGYLLESLPETAPEIGEDFQEIFDDIEKLIMPGITHWQSPYFHGYYPTANSYPAILGDLLSTGIGCMGFNWLTSPSCTELEMKMMNWLIKLFNLPGIFLTGVGSNGGGVIQGSASEAALFTLLLAKETKIKSCCLQADNLQDSIKHKLVAYASEESNSSIEKAGLLGSVTMRLLPTDGKQSLRKDVLELAIAADKRNGLVPFFVVCTLGTTNSCAFDNLAELAAVCAREHIWLHVDAAYAGAAFICPEYQYILEGVDLASSISINLHKWMLVNFDCSALWLKNTNDSLNVFKVDRIYLDHKHHNDAHIPDYRNWQISLGRRFRALKLWMVLRSYGAENIRRHIRKQIDLAKQFEELVRKDSRFEIVSETRMALVCFRLKESGDNRFTLKLIENLLERKKIFVTSGHLNGSIMIRFAICSRLCEFGDILQSWNEIQHQASLVLQHFKSTLN